MPGTPMNPDQSELNKLQNEESKEVQQNESEPVVRELTQTDVLNKRLLVSFLKKINNKSDEEVSSLEEKETENDKDQSDSDF